MTTDALLDKLNYARSRCNEIKEEMNKATAGWEWRRAEEDLNFWQGKTAYYESQLKAETGR